MSAGKRTGWTTRWENGSHIVTKGAHGNPRSKICEHKFDHGQWNHKKCIKCGARYRGKHEQKPLLRRIFT